MQLQYVFLTEYSFNVANSVLLKPTQPCKSLHMCQATPFYKQKKKQWYRILVVLWYQVVLSIEPLHHMAQFPLLVG